MESGLRQVYAINMWLALTALFLVAAAIASASNVVFGQRAESYSAKAGCLSIMLPVVMTLLASFGLAYYLASSCAPGCDGAGPVMIGAFGLLATIPAGLGGGTGYILAGLWTGRKRPDGD
ncbi:hypothetical protein GCM10022280_21950 [Sphingomonas swuensis]|uniref:Uncharacterized protein n=1 Tax=Sphingomonas swuensis TaxID=977800 RepID=A0ABP7T4Y8_9SPHN